MNTIALIYILIGLVVSLFTIKLNDKPLPTNRIFPILLIMVTLWLPLILFELVQGDYKDEV